MPDSQNTTNTDNVQGGQGFPADNHRTGEPGLIGKDAFTIKYETEKLNRGHTTVLSGNYADLQRIGAALAIQGKLPEGVAPPGVDAKNALTPAQHDAAKGEWTVESERAGLMSRPVPPTPEPDYSPTPVDPAAVSPTTIEKGKSASSMSPKPQSK